MSTNVQNVDYSLQEQLKDLVVPSTVTVVGVGGAGSWIAFFAALAGVKRLILIDPGIVDAKDVARGPFTHKQIGISKVKAIRDLILERRPLGEADVQIYDRRLDLSQDEDLLEGTVFATASNQSIVEGLAKVGERKKIKVISAGYNGLYGYVFSTLPQNLIVKEGDGPVWVGATALAGLLAVYSAFVKPFTFMGPVDSKLAMDVEDVRHLAAGRSVFL